MQKEKNNIVDRMNFYYKFYKEILKIASEVNDQAIRLSKILKLKRVSNCKVLAKKVKQYKIRSVIRFMLLNLIGYKKFFMNSYKGFYCTICDAAKHKFIDLIEKRVIYSQTFCRNMLRNNF